MNHPPLLFEDAEALIIDKPAGLPVETPRAGGPSLADHLDALRFGFQRLPAAVHRLDTDTSGCLLLARTPRALTRFSLAFEERRVMKRYLGVVAGEVGGEEGTIALSLAKISSAAAGWRMIAAKKGKEAVTHWRVVERRDGLTLVEFTPETGRTHQIRVHAKAGLGHALLGDPVYGEEGAPKRGARRTLLHAASLRIDRPTKDPVEASAPFPADFAALGFADPDHGTFADPDG